MSVPWVSVLCLVAFGLSAAANSEVVGFERCALPKSSKTISVAARATGVVAAPTLASRIAAVAGGSLGAYNGAYWILQSTLNVACSTTCASAGGCVASAFPTTASASTMSSVAVSAGYSCGSYNLGNPTWPAMPIMSGGGCYYGNGGYSTCAALDSQNYRFCPCANGPGVTPSLTASLVPPSASPSISVTSAPSPSQAAAQSYNGAFWILQQTLNVACSTTCASAGGCVASAFPTTASASTMASVAVSAGYSCGSYNLGNPTWPAVPIMSLGGCYYGNGGYSTCAALDSQNYRFCPCANAPGGGGASASASLPPSATPTPAPSQSSPPSPTSAPSQTAAVSPTSAPSQTAAVSPTSAPSQTAAVSPTSAPSQTAAVSPTSAPSQTAAVSPTSAPSQTAAVSPTSAPSQTAAVSPTSAPSQTAAVSPTSAPSQTSAVSPSPSQTPAASDSETPSPSSTESASPSGSVSPSWSATRSTSPSSAATSFITPTVSATRSPTYALTWASSAQTLAAGQVTTITATLMYGQVAPQAITASFLLSGTASHQDYSVSVSTLPPRCTIALGTSSCSFTITNTMASGSATLTLYASTATGDANGYYSLSPVSFTLRLYAVLPSVSPSVTSTTARSATQTPTSTMSVSRVSSASPTSAASPSRLATQSRSVSISKTGTRTTSPSRSGSATVSPTYTPVFGAVVAITQDTNMLTGGGTGHLTCTLTTGPVTVDLVVYFTLGGTTGISRNTDYTTTPATGFTVTIAAGTTTAVLAVTSVDTPPGCSTMAAGTCKIRVSFTQVSHATFSTTSNLAPSFIIN